MTSISNSRTLPSGSDPILRHFPLRVNLTTIIDLENDSSILDDVSFSCTRSEIETLLAMEVKQSSPKAVSTQQQAVVPLVVDGDVDQPSVDKQ